MPLSHICLTVLVTFIWGVTFLFLKLGLEEFPPFLLCALRFMLISIPAVFFIKVPNMPVKLIIWYGLIIFGLQFSLLAIGLTVGMTPGMASLILQTQVFFSMFFSTIFLKERPNIWQMGGALISFTGIGVVALHLDKNISLLGFLFVLGSAASWGLGNLIIKKAKNVQMFSLVVWGTFVAFFPMIIISLFVEGPGTIVSSFKQLTWLGALSLLYIVYASIGVGYGIWNWLLSNYSINTITPFTLLVPIIGILSSVLVLHEPLTSWKLLAVFLVIGGLSINITRGYLSSLFNRK